MPAITASAIQKDSSTVSFAGNLVIDSLPRPKKVNNHVVAHRGGSMETGVPDNSLEALNYAMGLKCYASECDIYITKDNKVIVAHADGNDKINGLHPWEATYEKIASVAKLPNEETIPTLEVYLDRLLQGGSTKLWLDVKSISSIQRSEADELTSRCSERASEIVRQKKANHFVEFIVAGKDIYDRTLKAAKGDWPCGLMDTGLSPEDFKNNGYKWANFQDTKVFYHDGQLKGAYSIRDYTDAGIAVSVYHVDTEQDKAWYVKRNDVYALTTNYPKALLKALAEER
ncbi:glycerophosphoryl diester phosphodiesterase [Pedobacter hartonius]|uniref:Glycerophosphoryl diester phosphodiesterase n=1 Tax=Pedobacter hartonius TaxID=425514 RepID=A0A1H4H7A5_9SPHI|nr:glycerophosphoryl diester phosphodiesterase [Pedobacter hartonius]